MRPGTQASPTGPDAVIAGFARCGSTLLARALASSPRLFVAGQTRPEPKALLGWNGNLAEVTGRYASVFADAPVGALRVEKSTSYSDHLDTSSLMRTLFPQTRVIFIVRDPIERFLSNYHWSVQGGMETRTLAEAVSGALLPQLGLPAEPRPHDYLWRSLYGNHLHAWLRYWPREQLHVCQFERLISDIPGTLAGIADFLGIEDSFEFEGRTERVNAAERPRDESVPWTTQARNGLETLARGPLAADVALLVRDWPEIDINLWASYRALLGT